MLKITNEEKALIKLILKDIKFGIYGEGNAKKCGLSPSGYCAVKGILSCSFDEVVLNNRGTDIQKEYIEYAKKCDGYEHYASLDWLDRYESIKYRMNSGQRNTKNC